ncbi:hypothetical protein ACFL6U_31425, partial [Planctomycetota bacterium]
MSKNLTPRIIVILVLVALAAFTLIPPSKTLKQGIDLAGGTSLTYEIDAQGLTSEEKRGLSGKMITVLRRRVDPANIQNLVWRPQGDTRFEIQMPLASQEAQDLRQAYNDAITELLGKNINTVTILQALRSDEAERTMSFETIAQGDPNRMAVLDELSKVYSERAALQQQRDVANEKMAAIETQLKEKGSSTEFTRLRTQWSKLDDAQLLEALANFPDLAQDPNSVKAYLAAFNQWTTAVAPLTRPDSGLNETYRKAIRDLSQLN